MAITLNLDAVLMKQYESSSVAELADSPVTAIAGVSKDDAEALRTAFNIKTVRDLATNKYVRAAQTITELAAIAGK